MAVSEDVLIIIVVAALIVALLLILAVGIYVCCARRRRVNRRQQTKPEVHSTRHYVPPRADNSGPSKIRLDKLPTAAQTKKMEEGSGFVGGGGGANHVNLDNAKSIPDEDASNYIMGPSSELTERENNSRALDNKGFIRENQVESGAYFRGGLDPADVAEVYMKDEYLKEATRLRRKQQLEVRRKASKSSSNAKKNGSRKVDSRPSRPHSSGQLNMQKPNSKEKSGHKRKSTTT